MRSAGQRRLGGLTLAELPVEGQVVWHRIVNLRRAGGVARLHYGFEFLEVGHDCLGALTGSEQTLRHHHRKGLADVVDPVHRQRRMRRRHHVRPVFLFDQPAAGQITKPVRRHVGAGEHRFDAVDLQRAARVDGRDACPRIG